MSGYKPVDKVFVIETEPEDICEYCGAHKETRPYGKNGAKICFQCAMKSENKAETEDNFKLVLRGAPEEVKN